MLHDRSNLSVRPASAGDADELAAMIRSLALHEGKRDVSHITATAVEEWFFGADPVCSALLAEHGNSTLGYIAWYPIFSPFKGGRVYLVENLWVEEAARGSGAGRALLQALARRAQQRGIPRIELNVRADNETTRRFYSNLGFIYPGEHVCRIEDASLMRLAASGEAVLEAEPAAAPR